jgi:hypothetical protein
MTNFKAIFVAAAIAATLPMAKDANAFCSSWPVPGSPFSFRNEIARNDCKAKESREAAKAVTCDSVCVAQNSLSSRLQQPALARFEGACKTSLTIPASLTLAETTESQAKALAACLVSQDYTALMTARTTADIGKTSLFSGQVVTKQDFDHIKSCRVSAGNTDELSTCYFGKVRQERDNQNTTIFGGMVLGVALLVAGSAYRSRRPLNTKNDAKPSYS